MAGSKPDSWWKLQSARQDYRRPEVKEHEEVMRQRALAAIKHPRYWVHLPLIAILLTQSRLVIGAVGAEGNIAWAMSLVISLTAGLLVACIWHALRRPPYAQTGRRFVIASWVVAALVVAGSYQ